MRRNARHSDAPADGRRVGIQHRPANGPRPSRALLVLHGVGRNTLRLQPIEAGARNRIATANLMKRVKIFFREPDYDVHGTDALTDALSLATPTPLTTSE